MDDAAGFMDAVGLKKADVFGYSMGAIAGLQLAIRHPQKVNRLVAASVAYDVEGWQREVKAAIPQMKVEEIVRMPFASEYRKLTPGDRASIYRGVLSARHGKARDESRQLPARLRRAVRAWLEGRING